MGQLMNEIVGKILTFHGIKVTNDSAVATIFNIFPQLGVEILESIEKSQVGKARQTLELLTEVYKVITKNGPWVPTMKVAMQLYTPIKVGKARESLLYITPNQIQEIIDGIRALDFL